MLVHSIGHDLDSNLSPLGVLRAIAEDYLRKDVVQDVNVGWLCNISRNGLVALANGDADIALTYERDQEEVFIAERGGMLYTCLLMHLLALITML